MKPQLQKTASGKKAVATACTTLLFAVTCIGSTIASAQTLASKAEPKANTEKSTTPTKKLAKIPAKLAQLTHIKKTKKSKVVDGRMSPTDAPGTVTTQVSNVKLKKIPLNKDKAEEVSVAQ